MQNCKINFNEMKNTIPCSINPQHPFPSILSDFLLCLINIQLSHKVSNNKNRSIFCKNICFLADIKIFRRKYIQCTFLNKIHSSIFCYVHFKFIFFIKLFNQFLQELKKFENIIYASAAHYKKKNPVFLHSLTRVQYIYFSFTIIA